MLMFGSCKPDKSSKAFSESDQSSDALPGLVHNPVRPDGSIDSSYLPIITFKDTLFDFGTVSEGDTVIKDFIFTNTGTAPLLITQATSTCGCTIPKWPTQPIL